jgi:hypothetical protein
MTDSVTSNPLDLLVKRMRSLSDLASHKEPAISEALVDGVIQIERLRQYEDLNTRLLGEIDWSRGEIEKLQHDIGRHVAICAEQAMEIERLRAALMGIKTMRLDTQWGIDPMRAAGIRHGLDITREIAEAALAGTADEAEKEHG